MSLIADREKATRLARAIVADIELYNKEAISTQAPSVAENVREGRELFEARVVPELHDLFDSVVRGSVLAPWAGDGSPAPLVPARTRAPVDPVVDAPRDVRPDTRSITGLMIGLFVFMIVAAVVIAYLARGH